MADKKKFHVFATSRIGDPAENRLRERGYELEVFQGPEAPPKKLIIDKLKSGIDGLITTREADELKNRHHGAVSAQVGELTGWGDVAAGALAARSAGKNLCPQSLPAQKGEKVPSCSSESRMGVQGRSALRGR
jgi:hypothetical protein